MSTAIVFAYHDVGHACLKALLDYGIEVKLVVTHEDNPNETIWFASVRQLALVNGLEVLTPAAPEAIAAQCQAIKPDFIFSFYYRHMLPLSILTCAKKLALNMHGSLLPKYRGRVPINWAIIHGETETGASLHVMVEKPDAGALIDQQAVSIASNDTAQMVFAKVTNAATLVLKRSLPSLENGSAQQVDFPLLKGQYFGGRKPKDSEIHWSAHRAASLHNFVRALAPPFPSAFFAWRGQTLCIEETRVLPPVNSHEAIHINKALQIVFSDGSCCQITQHNFPAEFLAALPYTPSTP